MKLSEHIDTRYDNVLCPCCGRGAMELSKSGILPVFEELRAALNKSFKKPVALRINSGFRCWDHHVNIYKRQYGNEWEKHIARNSKHLKGLALDIAPIGISIKDFQTFCLSAHENKTILKGGLGLYKTFAHIDVSNYRLWSNI